MLQEISYDVRSRHEAAFLLSRPRIGRLFAEAFQKPLTLVVAGAGYGKTCAVSSALESEHRTYAWVHLSEMDNSLSILWRRLVQAIGVSAPALARSMRAMGCPDSPSAFFLLLQMVEEALRDTGRFVLVLDDFHSLWDKAGLKFFENLIAADLECLAIVLISRETPSLSLTRLLSEGRLERITEEDLRFTQEEMEDYFRMQGETLGAETSARLYAFTEGWILAINLMRLSMSRSAFDHGSMLKVKIDIFALIDEEVYARASKELKKFLAVLALLDAPPKGLIEELAADTPQVLAELRDVKFLLRYDAHSGQYRMHRVFRDFLFEKGDLLTTGEMESVYLTTARWYRAHHSLEEAINYYWQCGCYPELFDTILSIRRRVSRDLAELFISLIEETPADILEQRPVMRVVKALQLFNNNRIQEAEDTLRAMRNEYESPPLTQERAAILGEVYLLLGLIQIVKQEFGFLPLFQKADKLLPKGSALIDSQLNIAEGMNIVGIKHPVAGELKRYQEALFEVAPYAVRVMNGCGYGMEYLNATDCALMSGEIHQAEKFAYETLFRAQHQQQYGIEFMANFYLIRILVYKGDYERIDRIFNEMKEKMERAQNADCMTLYDIIKGWFYVKIGQTSHVAKWILFEEETRKMLAPVILGREYLVRSDCLLAEGRYYELLGFMKQSDIIYERRGILYARIQNRITESVIHHYLGNHGESMEALHAAYALSHANHLVYQYIEYGSQMRAVLKAAMKDDGCEIPLPWLKSVLAKSSTYAKRLIQIKKEYAARNLEDTRKQVSLSKRELEILECIAQGLTRDEIASTCDLSMNTVRSVQKSILNKLGAVNNLDAVRIATMMGLIS